jgi:hypothetical protein
MPMLMLMLALVADVGSLQVEKVRLRWAQDMALVDAVTEIDGAHYAATGRLQVDPSAANVYRAYLVANLKPMRGLLAAGATPESIAQQAEVAIVNNLPATNPFTGHTLDRPAICARIRVPLMSGLLHLAGLSDQQTLTIDGDAEIKGDVR